MKEHGFAEEMLDGLLNLDLALTCDGFVSSINSNWARWVGGWAVSSRVRPGLRGGGQVPVPAACSHTKPRSVVNHTPLSFVFTFVPVPRATQAD
jgi:hypothetical protein